MSLRSEKAKTNICQISPTNIHRFFFDIRLSFLVRYWTSAVPTTSFGSNNLASLKRISRLNPKTASLKLHISELKHLSMLWVPKPVFAGQGPHFGYLSSKLMLRWHVHLKKKIKQRIEQLIWLCLRTFSRYFTFLKLWSNSAAKVRPKSA